MDEIEGVSVERDGKQVTITFSNRYGESEEWTFPVSQIKQIVGAIRQLVPEVDTGPPVV